MKILTTSIALVGLLMWSVTTASAIPVVATSNDVLAGIPRVAFTDVGPLPAATPIRLAVVLRLPRQRELDSFVARQQAIEGRVPALSARQFRDYFAPSAAQYQSVESMLRHEGFRVVKVYANRSVLDVAGPAAVVERLFETKLHQVRMGRTIGYANVAPAHLPPQMSSLILGVAGFDNITLLHVGSLVRGLRANPPAGPRGNWLGPDGGYAPALLEAAYDFPTLHGKNGTGQGVGIVVDSDYNDSDLTAFLAQFGIVRAGPATTRITVDGGPVPPINGDGVITAMQAEQIVGLAPGVSLYVYEMPNLTPQSILDAYAQANSDNAVSALTSDFAGCEQNTTPANFPQLVEQLAQEGAAQGVQYVAEAGDSGAYPCFLATPTGLGVDTPASSPDVLAVGGATLLVHPGNASYSSEITSATSGGGVSAVFARPAYQTGVKGVLPQGRNIPDLTFVGSFSSGISLYYFGTWNGPVGATYTATPVAGALVAELDQIAGKRVTSLHQALYQTVQTKGYRTASGVVLFHDIVFGTNTYYRAHPGFDSVSGIGSIDGWNFSQNAVGL